jgi:uncharacterized protein (TIGR02300 family)
MFGKKYICSKCSCKFYDLNRPQAVCPKCGTEQETEKKPAGKEALLSRKKGMTEQPESKDVDTAANDSEKKVEEPDDSKEPPVETD